ncbi:hypothetical protein OSA15_02360 [Treponema pallidum]|nr:hypothetical protein OSA15_02360 [Treponema pallidum]
MRRRYRGCTQGAWIVSVGMLFASCTSGAWKASVDPLGVVGSGADVYLYFPVAGNENLISRIIENHESKADIKKIVDRTTAVYGAFFARSKEFRLFGSGSYPYAFTNLIFSRSDGWASTKTEHGITYYESEHTDVSIPAPHFSCVIFGSSKRERMSKMLSRLVNPDRPQLPPRFEKECTSEGTSQTVALYIKNGGHFITKLLNFPQLNLPLGAMELYLTARRNEYLYTLSLQLGNAKINFPIQFLISRVLNAHIHVEGDRLIIEDGTISAERLASVISSLYSKKGSS